MDAAGKLGAVEHYLLELATQRQLSPHTILAYRRDLAELAALTGDAAWDSGGPRRHPPPRLQAAFAAT